IGTVPPGQGSRGGLPVSPCHRRPVPWSAALPPLATRPHLPSALHFVQACHPTKQPSRIALETELNAQGQSLPPERAATDRGSVPPPTRGRRGRRGGGAGPGTGRPAEPHR